MSLSLVSEVKWTIPHGGQNCVKNTTLYIQGQCLFLTHQPFQVSCLLPSFGRLSKSVLTKCDNCLEVRWTNSSFVYDKQHFHLEVKWDFPYFRFFFFFFFFCFVLFCFCFVFLFCFFVFCLFCFVLFFALSQF